MDSVAQTKLKFVGAFAAFTIFSQTIALKVISSITEQHQGGWGGEAAVITVTILVGFGLFGALFALLSFSYDLGWWRWCYPRRDLVGTWEIHVFSDSGEINRMGICWIEEDRSGLRIWGETFEPVSDIDVIELSADERKSQNVWEGQKVSLLYPVLFYSYDFSHFGEVENRKHGFAEMLIRGGSRRPERLDGWYVDTSPAVKKRRMIFIRRSRTVTKLGKAQ